MYHYLILILEKKPDHFIIHVRTNDATSIGTKQFIKEKLQNCNVILAMSTKCWDNLKAYATVNLVNEQFSQFNIKIFENNNISDKYLTRHGLHLANHGRVRLAMNFISYEKKLWRFNVM